MAPDTERETEAEIKQRKKREREPLAFCVAVAKRPGLAFGLALTGHVLLMSINFILMATGYDILNLEVHHFPVMMKQEVTYQREYAWLHRDEDPDKIFRFTIDDIGPTWDRGYFFDQVVIYYYTANPSDNLFQKKYFLQMEEIEDTIFNLTDYQQKFCQLDGQSNCLEPTSILRYFDGTFRNVSDALYDPTFDRIPEVLYEAYSNPTTKDDFLVFMGKGFHITPTEATCNLTRSYTSMGWPLEGEGSDEEKEELVGEFLQEQVKPIIESAMDDTQYGMQINYISAKLFVMDVLPQAMYDMMLAIGSMFFILAVIWIQTGSFWISGWAVFSIITCFWITNLIYRCVLQYLYFGYFHIISIFIILGIGADDIFIFVNAWKATGMYEYRSLAHRLSDCYRRSGQAMFFTSFTTMSAFLVGGISPILPLGSFGIFTGILIAVNYVSVVVYFPTVLITHHVYFEKSCCPPCCYHGDQEDTSSVSTPSVPSDFNSDVIVFANDSYDVTNYDKDRNDVIVITKESYDVMDPGKGDNVVTAIHKESYDGMNPVKVDKIADTKAQKKPNPMVIFFAGKYYRFVTHKVIRWVIIGVFLTFLGVFIWSATRIEPSTEEIKIYRDTTNYGKAMKLAGSGFVPSGDRFVTLYLVWGLQPQDFDECHFTDWECGGQRSWDNTFGMNSPPAQRDFWSLCHKLMYDLTEDERQRLMIRNDTITGHPEVDCFMDQLNSYMLDKEKSLLNTKNASLNLDYPLTQGNMDPFMYLYPAVYEPEKLDRDFYNYFEIGISAWINNDYTMLSQPDFITYNSLLGEVFDPPYTQPVKLHHDLTNGTAAGYGYYGSKLRYATIRVNLSLSEQELGYFEGLPVRDDWEDFFNEQVSTMTPSLQGGFQVTETTWHWLEIQKALSNGAWMGIAIGIAIAFPVLVIATMNIIVGFMALILIGCVTAGVLGVIPMAGWKLDIMVSMNLTLLVGLSVDYILHMAEGYHASEHTDRAGRIADMLANLAVSVISGAITTIGAAIFMLFAKIQFFFQFGTFMFCTIGFSLAFSLVFFPAVLSLIGPEGDTGDITKPFKALARKIKGRAKSDVDCGRCEGKGFMPNADSGSSSASDDSDAGSSNQTEVPPGEVKTPPPPDTVESTNDTECHCRRRTIGHINTVFEPEFSPDKGQLSVSQNVRL